MKEVQTALEQEQITGSKAKEQADQFNTENRKLKREVEEVVSSNLTYYIATDTDWF